MSASCSAVVLGGGDDESGLTEGVVVIGENTDESIVGTSSIVGVTGRVSFSVSSSSSSSSSSPPSPPTTKPPPLPSLSSWLAPRDDTNAAAVPLLRCRDTGGPSEMDGTLTLHTLTVLSADAEKSVESLQHMAVIASLWRLCSSTADRRSARQTLSAPRAEPLTTN